MSSLKEAYSLETTKQIFNNMTGERWEIGNDFDGLGLVSIRYYNGVNNKDVSLIIDMPKPVAILMFKALNEFLCLGVEDSENYPR